MNETLTLFHAKQQLQSLFKDALQKDEK